MCNKKNPTIIKNVDELAQLYPFSLRRLNKLKGFTQQNIRVGVRSLLLVAGWKTSGFQYGTAVTVFCACITRKTLPPLGLHDPKTT